MDSLLFLGAVIAIAVIVWWEIQNDQAPADGATRGLLAMKTEATRAKQDQAAPGRAIPGRKRPPG